MRLTVEIFLSEANDRALKEHKKAYCHVVGLGLGVWQIHNSQSALLLQVFEEALNERRYEHVDIIDFSWFNDAVMGSVADGQFFTGNGNRVLIKFTKNDPAAVSDEKLSRLLVAMYAWDGNSFPGNEYWIGMLAASGDPAAAACSCIGELQNSMVNPYLCGSLAVVHPDPPARMLADFALERKEAKLHLARNDSGLDGIFEKLDKLEIGEKTEKKPE